MTTTKANPVQSDDLSNRLLRINQIIGDKNNPPLIPVGRSTWLRGVKTGKFPPPIRISEKVLCWRYKDVVDLINSEPELIKSESDDG